MPEVLSPESYQQLLVRATPLIDVRAPVEYRQGSFPAAVNLPLLNDEEREAVGKRYRMAGQDAAIDLGHQLISGSVREQRMQQWIEFARQHDDAAIFCFRGGLRSRTVQNWLQDAGYPLPRIAGGYKALRRYLIDTIEHASASREFLVIGGKTGCAKTRLLGKVPGSLDLEGIARHRGSAFGTRVAPQPTQIGFELELGIQLLRLPYTDFRRLVVEDEGHAIGSLSIPLSLITRMRQAPLAIIEEPLTYRIDTVLHAYIEVNFGDFLAADPASAADSFAEYLRVSLAKIRRRLGNELYQQISQTLNFAIDSHLSRQDINAHRLWIEQLLRDYYDPMYEYQLQKKAHRIVFRGSSEEFLRWAARLQLKAG